ncbi:hypothetical protein B0H16DRAFT_1713758 [Mycena metata]|uniref:Uncharacterized protein n=1 Tax=Mycena metata TaxID=1033252 RepID=A0AAD7NSM1_9AGAR|nr:hypothetical protein B0H16DRAFT_1713758 [Mycena metata]
MTSTQDSAAAIAALAQELLAQRFKTYGPLLIGFFLSTILFGVTLLQTYQYYDTYGSEDRRHLVIMVGF